MSTDRVNGPQCKCGKFFLQFDRTHGMLPYFDVGFGEEHRLDACGAWQDLREKDREKKEGMKFDQDKERYDLMPELAEEALVKVLTYGAKKYAPDNWRTVGEPRRRYFAAMRRHMKAWRKGERLDPQSGLPHLAHAICSLMFLLEREEEEQ